MKPTVQTLLSWVNEAMVGHSGWRQDCWEDAEFKDGVHWTTADYNKLIARGINPITVNRIFPVLNLIHGNYIRNQKDIIAKGRTKYDHELSQVMSEAIAYVVDQNYGTSRQRAAFESQITVGYGGLCVGFNSDPRKEKISIRELPWYSIWWDPYGTPWLETDNCRYVFTAEWKDLQDVKMAFPEHAKDLDEQYHKLADTTQAPYIYDLGSEIEDYKQMLSSGRWVNTERTRVRPVEIWYTVVEPGLFAVMPDSRVYELDKYDDMEQINIVRYSKEVVKAHVKKMYVSTILGELQLQETRTPYPHDEFPYVPYVGYLDRYNFPYGVPRQIKEQNMEVNKRRSMGLALINSRRTKVEEGAAEDLNVVHDEANRLDSFIVMRPGKLDAVKIEDMSALAAPQIAMMQQSEQEIKEIAGANDEALNYDSPVQSGTALEIKKQLSATMVLSLFDNAHRSQKLLGERLLSLIQSTWTGEKVMRVIDRLSGVEKFIEINKHDGLEVKNDITQGRFDLVIATKTITDTMREKNLDLLFSAINKAPPEAVAPLLNVAFEISDIPEKERILAQIREATGFAGADDDLTVDQRKALQQQKQVQQQQQAEADRLRQQQSQDIVDEEHRAKATKAYSEGQAALIIANAQKQKIAQDGFVAGYELMSPKEASK